MISDLFVYGTLRTDSRYSRAPDLSRYGVLIGRATMRGLLYRVRTYPGIVASKHPAHVVVGEVYRLHHPRRAFLILDAYEGKDFARKLKCATLASGETLDAWVYQCRLDVRRKPRILSGDFLAPLVTPRSSRIL